MTYKKEAILEICDNKADMLLQSSYFEEDIPELKFEVDDSPPIPFWKKKTPLKDEEFFKPMLKKPKMATSPRSSIKKSPSKSPGRSTRPRSKSKKKTKLKYRSDSESQEESNKLQLPEWLKENNIRDSEGRRILEIDYDPTTVLIPHDEYKRMTSAQKEYWDFKKTMYNKLVAFRIWNFYYFYFNDALILQKELDLKINFQKNGVFGVQIPESDLSEIVPKLLRKGHQIVMVEPVDSNMDEAEDDGKRQICQVLTRGTYLDSGSVEYAQRFCLCIFEENLNYGIIYVDTMTHEFFVGNFRDQEHRTQFRALVTKIQPVEVVFCDQYITTETLNIVRGIPSKPVLSPLKLVDFNIVEFIKKLWGYFTPENSNKPKLPDLLDCMILMMKKNLKERSKEDRKREAGEEKELPFYYSFAALNLCLTLLENILLADSVFIMGNFQPYDIALEKKSCLYLDSQALQNLEVLEVSYLNYFQQGLSLLGYMDKTVTPYGKRLFKRWIQAPLADAAKINERLNAVEDLLNNMEAMQFFQKKIKSFGDLEKSINKIYNFTPKRKMTPQKLETLAKQHLRDFIKLLGDLEKIEKFMESFAYQFRSRFESVRMLQLTSFREINIEDYQQKRFSPDSQSAREGFFPRIRDVVADLKGMVEEKDIGIVPMRGIDDEADLVMKKIDEVHVELERIINEQRRKFNYKFIKYVHTKYRYEMEFPEAMVEGRKRPKDFVITSKKKGVLRFHSPEIEACLADLKEYEELFQKILIRFTSTYFKKFYERNLYWHQMISCLAELDCLCSLASLASSMPLKCKPQALPAFDRKIFELRDMAHPCASLANPNFTRNDVVLGEDQEIFLITGPNMGGKSTLMRQTAVAIIMAQVGGYVPANHFRFSVIDRIFTRIGASDRILEGKSTFFVEMEETYTIVTEATEHSFVIMDELGRGTSTYDGVAVAFANLKYLTEQINCITMFATHYHFLLEEFEHYKNIATFQMASRFDPLTDHVEFLYKFIPGKCEKSFGISIAKMAGMPEEVIAKAKEMQNYISNEKTDFNGMKKVLKKFNQMIIIFKNLEEKGGSLSAVLRDLTELVV